MLVIITDGDIYDLSDAKSLLVDLSQLPCSVVIVGLEDLNTDFKEMHELCRKDLPLKDDDGRKCLRNVLQFVEFENAAKKGDLEEQMIAEIESQFMQFIKK